MHGRCSLGSNLLAAQILRSLDSLILAGDNPRLVIRCADRGKDAKVVAFESLKQQRHFGRNSQIHLAVQHSLERSLPARVGVHDRDVQSYIAKKLVRMGHHDERTKRLLRRADGDCFTLDPCIRLLASETANARDKAHTPNKKVAENRCP